MFLGLGFGNSVNSEKIVAIVNPNSIPIKRLISEAREHRKVIDATYGKKTRSVVITNEDFVVLACPSTETLTRKLNGRKTSKINPEE